MNTSLNSGSLRTASAIFFSRAITLSGSAEKSTEMLRVVCEKSRLWLATVVIWLFGTTYSVPSKPRTLVFRSVIASTKPETLATVTTSPTLYWSSIRNSVPLRTSLTIVCAASPMATPAIPAEVSSGARLNSKTSRSSCTKIRKPKRPIPVARNTDASVRICEARANCGPVCRDARVRMRFVIALMTITPIQRNTISPTISGRWPRNWNSWSCRWSLSARYISCGLRWVLLV
jgi:hypothetical protein